MIKWFHIGIILLGTSALSLFAQTKKNAKILFTSASKKRSPTGGYTKTEKIYWGEKTWLYTTSNYNYEEAVQDSFLKFPKASFYPPNSIGIPDDKRNQALEVFSSLIDSIFIKAKELKKTRVEINTFGYSDFTPRLSDMVVYDSMCRISKKNYLSQDEFAKLVSFYRANQLNDLLLKVIYDRLKLNPDLERIYLQVISEGKGTEIPDKKRVYKEIDDGRRKVVIYWRIAELL